MKVLVVLAVIFGTSLAAPQADLSHQPKIAPRTLAEELQDFIYFFPIEDIKALIHEHLQNDRAFGDAILYFQGNEWKDLVENAFKKPAVQYFIMYLYNAQLPVDDILDATTNFTDNALPRRLPGPNGSLRPFLDELEKILPADELVQLLMDKVQTSQTIYNLYTNISSKETRQLFEEFLVIPEVQRVLNRLTELGVNVDSILKIIYDFLKWGTPNRPSTA